MNSILQEKRPRRIFELTEREVHDLWLFFLDIGYISHEFHPSVHDIIDRMKKFDNETDYNQLNRR
jgi:hypothetical protein